VRRKITDKTCGVVPTHYGGASPDMDALRALCGDIPVIEDAALSFGATYKGKPLGTVGNYGIISFHHTKNISADQGGMLVMNTADPAIRQRIQTLYDNGTNRAAFLAGEADAYTWQMPGLGVSIPGMAAALLAGQLQSGDAIQAAHRTVWECYMDNLSGADGLQLPHIPAYNQNNCHVFYILLENTHIREHVRSGLAGKGIQAHFHYMPLHASAMGAQLGYKPEDLPVTMNAAERLLRLPLYAGLSEQECAAVCAAVREALA